jgi:SAM-dependent methyltransferase
MHESGVSWTDIAGWYDDHLTGGSGPHELATATTVALLPPVHGLTVLDIACGQGMAARAVARAGAGRVIGADVTGAMVAIASAHERDEPLGIDYRADDAQVLSTVGAASVDVVTCQLGLMDIPDLDATLAAVGRVLRPGGVFVFVIGHPCFLAPGAHTMQDGDGRWGRFVGGYLGDRFWRSSNPGGVRRVGNHHRTLATYLNALTAAGFAVEEAVEPPAGPLLARQQPVYASVPIFLAMRVRRS